MKLRQNVTAFLMIKPATLVAGRNSELQNIEYRISKDGNASLNLFFKQTEYIHSTFDVRRSSVSFSIRLAAFQAGGGAEH
jgi:hypothetical protein